MDASPPSDRALTELLDESRHAEETSRRTRERWLRQQTEELATVHGLLQSARDRSTAIRIRTVCARECNGTVRDLGRDYVLVRAEGSDVAVRLWGITLLTPEPGVELQTAKEQPRNDKLLIELLQDWSADLPLVTLGVVGAPPLTGTLRSVGDEVLTIETRGGTQFVVIASVVEAMLRAR